MTNPTLRELEQLSAYLDDELDRAARARLDVRLAADPDLRSALEELSSTRLLLRSTPKRRAPHNFTLTPRMAGIRPPVPRLVPALSWASAVAMLAFLCTFATGLLPRMVASSGAATAAPLAAQAPVFGNGASAPTVAPVERNAADTASPGAFLQAVPLATPLPTGGTFSPATAQPPAVADTNTLEGPTSTVAPTQDFALQPQPSVSTKATQPTAARHNLRQISIPWIYVWLALAVLLGGTALLIRWLAVRAFRRKYTRDNQP
jgi:hypothetical protein